MSYATPLTWLEYIWDYCGDEFENDQNDQGEPKRMDGEYLVPTTQGATLWSRRTKENFECMSGSFGKNYGNMATDLTFKGCQCYSE